MPELNFKSLLDSVRRQESSTDRYHDGPTKDLPIVNPRSGARGPYQVVPGPAMEPGYGEFGAKSVFDIAEGLFPGKKFDRTEQSARDLLDIPEVNEAYASTYLQAMIDRFDGNVDQALSAYNYGPPATLNADRKYQNVPPETQRYIDNIRQFYNQATGGGNYGITMSPRPQMRPKGPPPPAAPPTSLYPQMRPKGLLG
tara:strand:+ start:468 stop:1061 length:594 start_codon:yes stop_codon:yes gene_type:complete